MAYTFAFILRIGNDNPSGDFDWVIDFDDGVTPILPAIGDRVEFGEPTTSAKVIDRQIRFGEDITVVFWVKEESEGD